MLSEHFIASIGQASSTKGANANVATKDAGIFISELRPIAAQRAIFKKSAAAPNCLALSDSHVFAAQADKAVVNVYNRSKSNQEATVPFNERITSLTLACDDSVLVLGTAEGRLFLWEVLTGRLVTTAQSHLQPVTCVKVDQSSNFLLSASADSTVHVWSLLSLLSFSNANAQPQDPRTIFSGHRAAVSALGLGHSSTFSNFAVSASQDKVCLIWNYHNGSLLRTYLLPSTPLCLAIDPADRAIYLGYEDGSVSQLDLYKTSKASGTIDAVQTETASLAPMQPPAKSQWKPATSSDGPVLCIDVSFDACTLLTGHASGAVLGWDVSNGRVQPNILQAPLPGPVTNLAYLDIAALRKPSIVKSHAVVKPKVGAFTSLDGSVPGSYALHAELASLPLAKESPSLFESAMTSATFPLLLLEEGLDELSRWGQAGQALAQDPTEETDDFMSLDGPIVDSHQNNLEQQNSKLKAQVEALQRVQKTTFARIEKLNAEKKAAAAREQQRLSHRAKTSRPQANGQNLATESLDLDLSDSASDSG